MKEFRPLTKSRKEASKFRLWALAQPKLPAPGFIPDKPSLYWKDHLTDPRPHQMTNPLELQNYYKNCIRNFSRLEKLSQPKPSVSDVSIATPKSQFGIPLAALSYSPSSRIIELSEPKSSYGNMFRSGFYSTFLLDSNLSRSSTQTKLTKSQTIRPESPPSIKIEDKPIESAESSLKAIYEVKSQRPRPAYRSASLMPPLEKSTAPKPSTSSQYEPPERFPSKKSMKRRMSVSERKRLISAIIAEKEKRQNHRSKLFQRKPDPEIIYASKDFEFPKSQTRAKTSKKTQKSLYLPPIDQETNIGMEKLDERNSTNWFLPNRSTNK